MARGGVFILIEGHAVNGLLYVRAAQRLGLHPITLSANPARYDYIATERLHAICVDTNDLDALINECSRLNAVDGIAGITGALDSVYATVSKLCRHFDLPGPDPVSIERCYDKFAQRQLLAQAGIPVPFFRTATSAADVQSSAAEIGLPVILKPVMGSGSSGVRLCHSVEALAEHTSYLLGGTHRWRCTPRILIEEFAQGPYYSAEMMATEFVGIAAADFRPPPYFVFREWKFPAVLTYDEHERIADLSLNCLRALDLGWGPTNIEFRWTKSGPVVIEVNPRLGGAPDPQLIQLAYGVDLITAHIKLAIGEKCDLRRKHSDTAAARMLVPDHDGFLDWIGGITLATAVPGITEVKMYVTPETSIVKKGDDRDYIGHVIAASPDLDRTGEILQHAVNLIEWTITPFSGV
ncbi:hypothetical protein CK231_22325 [Mesorhizobium loti]|uniref:ATP-grasp domain-containing protein n=1 Tax=Mesorhizobium TaxID=68287 RepID=UPI000BAFA661|nr:MULTISPECIES: acetyl-CoA carboxylase biotin carboxylase subunit family protein [Mesorhizobium]PBB11806.1 hypothetical protein CK231_22325 [Mesorhizobium loti]PBC07475.1 hypothetical protein CK230_26110 [Mesorhizobium sp. WSM3859]